MWSEWGRNQTEGVAYDTHGVYAECTARTLFPLQVLEESEEIKQALRDRDDDKVRELLDNFA